MNTDIQIQILRSRNFLAESKDHPPPPKKKTKTQPNKKTQVQIIQNRTWGTELIQFVFTPLHFKLVFIFGCTLQHNRADMLAMSQHSWRMIWAETELGSLLAACTQTIKSLNRINKNILKAQLERRDLLWDSNGNRGDSLGAWCQILATGFMSNLVFPLIKFFKKTHRWILTDEN